MPTFSIEQTLVRVCSTLCWVEANLLGLWRYHVAHVTLEGLDIQIPPADHSPDDDRKNDARVEDDDNHADAGDSTEREIVIDELVADEATLTILPRTAGKRPKVWRMHELHIQAVGARTKMPFHTVMTNAVPPGQITTTGSFGPWNKVVPRRTPLEGTFTFKNANLGVFKGISGILSAQGSYTGELERIDVNGVTDTPNFMVKVSGHTVPLETKYHAIVDATGALIGFGLPEYQAKPYEGRMRKGGIPLSVHADDQEWVSKGKLILEQTGAEDISLIGETKGDFSNTNRPTALVEHGVPVEVVKQ